MITTTTLAQAVLDHALAHYNDGGWDVLVECWTIEMVEEELAATKVRSTAGAIRNFKPVVAVWADQQADARNSAF